jgi:hypothetical protein
MNRVLTSKKTAFLIVTAMRASNLTWAVKFYFGKERAHSHRI